MLHSFIYFLNDEELSVNMSTPDSFLYWLLGFCLKSDFYFYPIFNTCAVVLVNLLRFSSISKEESQELPSEHTFWRDLVSAKFLVLSETTTAFTFFVMLHRRYLPVGMKDLIYCICLLVPLSNIVSYNFQLTNLVLTGSWEVQVGKS